MSRKEPKNDLIRQSDLLQQYLGGMSRSTLWKLEQRDKTFPRKVKFGSARQFAAYYRRDEIEAWLAAQSADAVDILCTKASRPEIILGARDTLAIAAMQGILSTMGAEPGYNQDEIARESYDMADAMLRARSS